MTNRGHRRDEDEGKIAAHFPRNFSTILSATQYVSGEIRHTRRHTRRHTLNITPDFFHVRFHGEDARLHCSNFSFHRG